MADELQRVGLIFKADGAVDFNKTIKQINQSVQDNRNSFQMAKAAWDESTASMDKLKDRQEYLTNQTLVYSDKVKVLERELEELENAENKNTQAIQKKKSQLTGAKVTLINYEKGLKDVTEQIESGSAVMQDEMKELDNTLGELSASAKENETAFALVKTEWKDGTKTVKKLKDEQEYLTSQTKTYGQQAEILEKQLKLLENAETKDEKAIREKRSELNQAKTSLNTYKSELEDVEKKLKNGAERIKGYTDKLDEFGEKAKNASEKVSGISAGAAGIVAGAAALVPATQEYRKIMASLESSSELAGYTADQTKETYRQLFGVLGDDQTAATTTANLQALGLTQQELIELTNGTIGAWAKYGDSIPIDGLAEAINETVRAGQVTGTLADVINWGSLEGERFGVQLKANTEANKEWNEAVESATTAEDFFNLALQEAGSNAERVNLVQKLLAEQGLTEAGKKWQETNKNIVDGNNATADFQETTGQLAETVAPIVSQITEIVADLMAKFNALPPETQKVIGGFVLLVAAISPLIGLIGGATSGVKLFSKGAVTLWGILSANPIGAVVTIIGTLVTAFITLYNTNEDFRKKVDEVFGKVVKVIKGAVEKIKGFFDFEWKLPDIKLPHFKITGGFSLMPPKVPKFKIDWYAKGGILNRPTVFGANGDSLMAGGEAGKEAVLPIELLKTYIREENKANNASLIAAFGKVIREMDFDLRLEVNLGNKKLINELVRRVREEISRSENGKLYAKGVTG